MTSPKTLFCPCRLIYMATLATGIMLAYTVAAVSPNMDVANAALPTIVTIWLFFIGYIIRVVDTPLYWRWFCNLDFLRFAWGALMINQFKDCSVTPGDGRTVCPFGGSYNILEHFGLRDNNEYEYLGYLTLFFVFFSFSSWALLSFKTYNKR